VLLYLWPYGLFFLFLCTRINYDNHVSNNVPLVSLQCSPLSNLEVSVSAPRTISICSAGTAAAATSYHKSFTYFPLSINTVITSMFCDLARINFMLLHYNYDSEMLMIGGPGSFRHCYMFYGSYRLFGIFDGRIFGLGFRVLGGVARITLLQSHRLLVRVFL
jgi:hypothetical protein